MSVEGGPETISEKGIRNTSQAATGIVQGESSGGSDSGREQGSLAFDIHLT